MFETIFWIALVAVAGYFLWTKVIKPKMVYRTPKEDWTDVGMPSRTQPRNEFTDNDSFGHNGN